MTYLVDNAAPSVESVVVGVITVAVAAVVVAVQTISRLIRQENDAFATRTAYQILDKRHRI